MILNSWPCHRGGQRMKWQCGCPWASRGAGSGPDHAVSPGLGRFPAPRKSSTDSVICLWLRRVGSRTPQGHHNLRVPKPLPWNGVYLHMMCTPPVDGDSSLGHLQDLILRVCCVNRRALHCLGNNDKRTSVHVQDRHSHRRRTTCARQQQGCTNAVSSFQISYIVFLHWFFFHGGYYPIIQMANLSKSACDFIQVNLLTSNQCFCHYVKSQRYKRRLKVLSTNWWCSKA